MLTSDPQGMYDFGGLPADTYTVCEDTPLNKLSLGMNGVGQVARPCADRRGLAVAFTSWSFYCHLAGVIQG